MSTAERPGAARLRRAEPPGPDVVLLELGGELDIDAAAGLRALLAAAAAERRSRVVVDLAEVTFIDSTILREIMHAHHVVADAGGRLVLATPQAAVTRLLELTGTTEVFTIADSRAAALAAL